MPGIFELVGFVFLTINGEQSDALLVAMHHKNPFMTEEKCMNYFDTREGAISKHRLEGMLDKAAHETGPDVAYHVEWRCLPHKGGEQL